MNAWKKHTQNNGETLPYANNGYQNDNNANGYYNNTQYPTTYGNQTTEYAPPAGAPPIKQPQAAYNPSTAGAYGQNGGTYSYGQNNTSNDNDGAHDYEYRQAEENRLAEEAEARRAAGGNEPAPPGYDAQPTGAAGQGESLCFYLTAERQLTRDRSSHGRNHSRIVPSPRWTSSR